LEILKVTNSKENEEIKPASKVIQNNKPLRLVDVKTIKLIAESVNDLADENGWTFLGNLGSFILKKKPDFDPRNYGFMKLLPLIKSIGKFEIDERDTGLNNIRHIYIKLK
jgi:hypothetical protein